MTLVVDASVAAKWIFNESDSDLARALRLDARRQGFELVAPEILPAEVGNVIGKRVVRGEIDPAEARSVFREFRDLCPALVRLSGLVEGALALSVRFRHSVYDGLYVALARERDCILVTADERLFRLVSPSIRGVRLLRSWV
jgi:predicted nucleic acid-binding protein